jgi:hypothetical protein
MSRRHAAAPNHNACHALDNTHTCHNLVDFIQPLSLFPCVKLGFVPAFNMSMSASFNWHAVASFDGLCALGLALLIENMTGVISHVHGNFSSPYLKNTFLRCSNGLAAGFQPAFLRVICPFRGDDKDS